MADKDIKQPRRINLQTGIIACMVSAIATAAALNNSATPPFTPASVVVPTTVVTTPGK